MNNTVTEENGANEFLSALTKAKFLESKGVEIKYIAAICACIAATWFQPLKHSDAFPEGDHYMQELASRLRKLNINLNEEEIDAIMYIATLVSNHDVGSFIGSWQNMLEDFFKINQEFQPQRNNPSYTSQQAFDDSNYGIYAPIKDGKINPGFILHKYKNTPKPSEFEGNKSKLIVNIDYAILYLTAQKIGAAFLVVESANTPANLLIAQANSTNRTANLNEQDNKIIDCLLQHSQTPEILATYKISGLYAAASIYAQLGRGQIQELYECCTNQGLNEFKAMLQQKIGMDAYAELKLAYGIPTQKIADVDGVDTPPSPTPDQPQL